MKYWIFDGKQAQGPYAVEQLKAVPGFGPETVVAPEGASSADQWRAAKTFDGLRNLFSKPPPLPRPLPGPAEASRTSLPAAGSPDVKVFASNQPVQAKEFVRQSHKARWRLLAAALTVYAIYSVAAFFYFAPTEQAVGLIKDITVEQNGKSKSVEDALSNMHEHYSTSWRAEISASGPDLWEVVYHYDGRNSEGQQDSGTLAWFVNVQTRQMQPRTLMSLRLSVQQGSSEFMNDLIYHYQCGKQSCSNALVSVGGMMSDGGGRMFNEEFSTLPWFRLIDSGNGEIRVVRQGQ